MSGQTYVGLAAKPEVGEAVEARYREPDEQQAPIKADKVFQLVFHEFGGFM